MPTREPATAQTERLSAEEVNDTADTSPRAEEPVLTGKRLRGIPAVITKSGDTATTIEISPQDLAGVGGPELKRKVVFDGRIDSSTIAVGDEDGQIPESVADFLSKNYPTSFEYINEG